MNYIDQWNVERLQAKCAEAVAEGNLNLYRFYRDCIIKWLGI